MSTYDSKNQQSVSPARCTIPTELMPGCWSIPSFLVHRTDTTPRCVFRTENQRTCSLEIFISPICPACCWNPPLSRSGYEYYPWGRLLISGYAHKHTQLHTHTHVSCSEDKDQEQGANWSLWLNKYWGNKVSFITTPTKTRVQTHVHCSQRGSLLMFGLGGATIVWGLSHIGNLAVSQAEAAPLPGTAKVGKTETWMGDGPGMISGQVPTKDLPRWLGQRTGTSAYQSQRRIFVSPNAHLLLIVRE